MNIVIIGSGFAGASVAWWLSRRGKGHNVTVLEQEDMPGMHSSGLNASLASQFEEDPFNSPLAIDGTEFIRKPPDGFTEIPLIELNGSLFLMDAATEHIIRNGAAAKGAKIISKKEASKKVPVIADAEFTSALWTPDDGIVDIHAYLWAFINGAKARGAKFVMNARIKGFKLEAGRIRKVETTTATYPADIVVNAAGGWAQVVAGLAGAEDLEIRPFRRHLYCTPVMPEIDPRWPFVWSIPHDYYFRPESGGLLMGACDEEEVPPAPPIVNPKIREVLAEKFSRHCPSLANVSIAREWCGLRTFTPDRRPVIDFDKKVKNFFWIAALGGRGMTCAASAGRLAAEKILIT
jgi:D-arginine dehydrogenase